MAPRPARPALLAVPVVLALGLAANATAVRPETPPASSATAFSGSVDTADDLPDGAVVTDEQIYQLTRAGDRVYAFGNFTTVGRYAGPGAVLGTEDGAPATSPEIADGQVSVAVGDGAGGWYLGGDFTRIGGQPAGGLAHVLNDGTLDTDFLPHANHLVSALALVGDTLYVGGAFTTIGGADRERLAALSVEDGSVLPFEAPQSARVTELLLLPPDEDPGRLYVAADGLRALDLTTGAPVPGFSATTDSPIHALALGDGRLYVGAAGVTALDPDTGAVDAGFDIGAALAVDAQHRVHTLLHTADRLYVGGDRTLIGGRPGRLVAVDPETGAVDPSFAPEITTARNLEYVDPGVYDLALNGDQLWAGGSFAGGLTVVDAETGATLDIDLPSYNLQVNAVEQSGPDVYVGGHFYMTDAVRTRRVAAFDADTLDPVPGFRSTTDSWGDLTVGAGALWLAETNFMGYDPSQIAAETGEFYYPWTAPVVALDPDTGARIEKRSLKVANLTGITTIGSRLYVARRLENDVRFPRNRIDVYGPGGKRVDTFLVPARGYITELSSLGGKLIAAGSFTPRRGSNTAILKLDPATGNRMRFAPQIEGPVYDVARSGADLIAAGLFTRVWDTFGTSQKRPGLTRMDAKGQRDGTFRPKAFTGNRVLLHIEVLGDTLWVGGAAGGFFDATTGAGVSNPTGLEFPGWVVGAEDDVAYMSFLTPNLAGRTGFKLGYIGQAG